MLLLDSHALYWWVARSSRLTQVAIEAIEEADDLAISSISWFELVWMVEHNRVSIDIPLHSWLDTIAQQVISLPLTGAIATTAVRLPSTFPGDPMDRLIYATAIEEGLQLVTSDLLMRNHPHPRQITIW